MPVLNQLPAGLQAPPEHLTAESREFFLHVIATGSYDAPARDMLVRFCEVRDRIVQARRELGKFSNPAKKNSENGSGLEDSGGAPPAENDRSSFVFTDKHGQPRIHPLVNVERGLINEYGKLFRLLGWDQAPPDGQLPLFPTR
jgi:hypothetical protein